MDHLVVTHVDADVTEGARGSGGLAEGDDVAGSHLGPVAGDGSSSGVVALGLRAVGELQAGGVVDREEHEAAAVEADGMGAVEGG